MCYFFVVPLQQIYCNGFILSNFHRDLPFKEEPEKPIVRNPDTFSDAEGTNVPS